MHHCHSRSPHQVHRERTKRTSRDKTITARIKASRTKGLLRLLLLQVEGGHGAIKNETVELMDGMVADGLCQGHSSLDAPSELNPPQRIPSPLLSHY